jgi:hypothetical protein
MRGGTPSGVAVPLRRNVEKILENDEAIFRGDAFGMELHAVHRKLMMGKAHDQAVRGLGRHRKLMWQGRAIDHQRVVACRLE